MILRIKRLDKELPLPVYQTAGAAGIDLYTADAFNLSEYLLDGLPFSFGIAVEIPTGYVGLVTTRSGIGFKLSAESRLGVIDSDYRGELMGKMYNFSSNEIVFNKGERIAQLLILPAPQFKIEEVDELDETDRGAGGFGSTGRS